MATENSTEYETARENANAATRVFEKVRDAYRKRLVDDQTFLAARRVYVQACMEFDIAYEAEQTRQRI